MEQDIYPTWHCSFISGFCLWRSDVQYWTKAVKVRLYSKWQPQTD